MTLNYRYNKESRIFQLILIGLVLVNSIMGQTTTKLYITVLPSTTLMIINNDTIALTAVKKTHMIGLEPGLCPVELWAPGYKRIRDTINIVEGVLNKYAKLLVEKTQEFKDYEKLNFEYKRQVKLKKNKKISLISASVLFSYYIVDGERFRIAKNRKRADRAYNNYISATNPSPLDIEYNNYLNAQENHNKAVRSAKKRLQIGIPLAILASVGTWYQIKKINKKKLPNKPIFESGPPFSKSNRKLRIESYGGSNEIGLRITF